VVIMITRTRVLGFRTDALFAGAIFLAVSVLVGAVAGATLGAAGQLVAMPIRGVVGVSALLAIAVAAVSRRLPWQLERETSIRWLEYQDWRTAAYNSASLSLGFATRIGFWMFYLVPIGAFMTGSALKGTLVYSIYGGARSVASLVLAAAAMRSAHITDRVLNLYVSLRTVGDIAFFMLAGYLVGATVTLITGGLNAG
jgi:hypothetical protein